MRRPAILSTLAAVLFALPGAAAAQPAYCLAGHVERDVPGEDFQAHAEIDVTLCFFTSGGFQKVAQIAGSFTESQQIPPIGDDPGFTSTCEGDFALSVPQDDGGSRETRYSDLTFDPGGVVSSGTIRAAALATCMSPFGMTTEDTIRSIGPGTHVIENGRIVKIDFDSVDPGQSVTAGELLPVAPGPTPTATPPPATIFTWTNGTGGSYATAANWDPPAQPGTVAGRDDTAVFEIGGSYGVTVSDARAARFVIRNGSVDLAGGVAAVTGSSLAAPSLTVGTNGVFNVVSGLFSSVHVGIGEDPVGLAAAAVQDAGAVWNASGRVTVGRANEGLLIITAGKLTSAEARIGAGPARGDAIVGGADARWETANLGLGFGGADGTLEVRDGGRVVSANAVIGVEDGPESLVTVKGFAGQPSSWKVAELEVGAAAPGRVEVLDGGRLDFDGLLLGNGLLGEGRARVAGPSSVIGTAESLLTVGRLETGELVVENGGRAEATTIFIGGLATGVADVRGIAGQTRSRLFATEQIAVGVNAKGTLRVTDRGETATDGDLVVGGAAAVEEGTVEIRTGGTLDAASVTVARGIFRADGTSVVNDASSTAVVFGDLVVRSAGGLEVRGGALVTRAGTLAIDGAVQVSNASLLGKRSELTAPFVELVVGRDEPGLFTIRNGGFAQSLDATIGRNAGSDVFIFGNPNPGAVDWEIERDLTINLGGLRFCPGLGLVTVGRKLVVGSNGTIAGNGTVVVPEVESDGDTEAGCSIGTLVVDGAFRQTARGRVVLEAAGAADVDVLRVTGSAALDGTFEVRFLDGYLPQSGDFLPFLDLEGAVSGAFARIVVRGVDEELVLVPAVEGGVTGFRALSDAKACGSPDADGDGVAECERCDDCVDDDGDGLVDRADPDCAPAANGAGLGVGGTAAETKALTKCAATMASVGAKLAGRTAKRLQTCADAVLACIQTKPGDAKCLAKAKATCGKTLAPLAPEGDDRQKARRALAKACGPKTPGASPQVPLANLVDAAGLGFGAETARCAALATAPLASVDAVIGCIDRATVCRASALVAARVPRLAELLHIAGVDAPLLACLPTTPPDAGALGDPKTEGKPLLKCQRAIAAAATKLGARLAKGYGGCAAAVRGCVHSTDPGCLAKATRVCAKATGGLPTVAGGADGKLLAAITKACSALAAGALQQPSGLGFGRAAARCAALGVPALDDTVALATCLTRAHACGAAGLVEATTPRLREHLSEAGVDLE